MPEPTITQKLGALLFAASGPLPISALAAASDESPKSVSDALSKMSPSLEAIGLGLINRNDEYRLVTSTSVAPIVRQHLQKETSSDLTRAALETLAIIAYRGPLARSQIEQIRGVSSDAMIRNLAARGLVTEAGKRNEPGESVMYTVSHEFLQHFGLASTKDLPPIPETPNEN